MMINLYHINQFSNVDCDQADYLASAGFLLIFMFGYSLLFMRNKSDSWNIKLIFTCFCFVE